ncbi:MAG: GcrA cell cycle regulator [Rhodobacteraceae bacterium]|nr:GcrA cell cycle regulator [Paracoccaceae bacterium]
MAWTEERVKLLITRWKEGRTASRIADELGGVTRNAVIGKINRLRSRPNHDLPYRAARKKAPAKPVAKKEVKPESGKAGSLPKQKAAAKKPAPPMPARKAIIPADQPLPPQPSKFEIPEEVLAQVAAVEKKTRKLGLMELSEKTCKWPIGDPATKEFWFCGHAVQQGKPYCAAHTAIAIQPMKPRRRP